MPLGNKRSGGVFGGKKPLLGARRRCGAFSFMRGLELSLSTFGKGGEGGLTPPPTTPKAPSFVLEPKSSGIFCPCWRSYPLRLYGRRTPEVARPPAGLWYPRAVRLESRGKDGPEGHPPFCRVSMSNLTVFRVEDGVAQLLSRFLALSIFMVGPGGGPTLAA